MTQECLQLVESVWETVFPFVPVALYLGLCLVTTKRQKQPIPEKRHPLLDARMTTNLTLAGFAFAVVGLLVTLFQNSIITVVQSVELFSVALASFFASYVLLFLRLRRAFDTISDGLTNNGLWCIMAGLTALFEPFSELEQSSWLFSLLLWVLGAYIATDLVFKWKDRKRTET
jgi:hypothetical protein